MRNLVFMVSCLTAAFAVGAEDNVAIPTAAEEAQPQNRERTLKQKISDLQKLQNEILELGGTINHPNRVRISLRVVEIDVLKLKQLGLAHPLQADERGQVQQNQNDLQKVADWSINYATDEELLKAFEPAVAKGCVAFLANPIVTTSIGQEAVMTCYREFPRSPLVSVRGSDFASVEEKPSELPEKSPGFSIEVLPRMIRDGEIHLTFRGRVNSEDIASSVKAKGRMNPGMSSTAMQTSIGVKPGKPYIIGGGSSSQTPIDQGNGKQQVGISAFLKPNAPVTARKVKDTVWLVTADELSSGGRGKSTSR